MVRNESTIPICIHFLDQPICCCGYRMHVSLLRHVRSRRSNLLRFPRSIRADFSCSFDIAVVSLSQLLHQGVRLEAEWPTSRKQALSEEEKWLHYNGKVPVGSVRTPF